MDPTLVAWALRLLRSSAIIRSSAKTLRSGPQALPRRTVPLFAAIVVAGLTISQLCSTSADEPKRWRFDPEQLQPFWKSNVIHRESVLFLRDEATGVARASVLFPIDKIISVEDSTGAISYAADDDFTYSNGAREIVVAATSRIVTKTAAELRRPANSQQFRLTHRDGNGEILFGRKLEYHEMQTWITYSKATDHWPVAMPSFDAMALPRTIDRLRKKQPVSIVLLGDSISTGCNASAWGNGAPFQPAYQDLVKLHLESHYKTPVKLTNLSVGGTSTPWGLTQIPEVVKTNPDLIILAFGMNDSAGRSAEEYGRNISRMISTTRQRLKDAEFILIAPMLGNRDWTALQHDMFPQYRDQLASFCEPGIAIADMTSVWHEFLARKKDHDLTGNGVNHPNDFGHRVYAQILSVLLIDKQHQP